MSSSEILYREWFAGCEALLRIKRLLFDWLGAELLHIYTSYPGFYFQNAGVVRRNAALRIPLIFCIPSICFNYCLVLCFYTIYKLSNSLMGY
jgi:hypothetical protein